MLTIISVVAFIICTINGQDINDPSYWNTNAIDALNIKKEITLKKDVSFVTISIL